MSLGSFALPPILNSNTGILTRFPFDVGANFYGRGYPRPIDSVLKITSHLRIDSLMINCCSHETLLHFGLQGSRLNICYYHQDLY